jgi:dihydrofolate reductase
MRKKVLYIAVTLDGYIADLDDGFAFLAPYDGLESVARSYNQLLERVDTTIMGYKTYEVIQNMGEWPYPDMKSYVMTSSKKDDKENIIFKSNIEELILELDQLDGKDIWVIGGGVLIQSMLEKNLIDEFQIAVVPKILGKGKPLFIEGNYDMDLKLVNIENLDGLVMLTYMRK